MMKITIEVDENDITNERFRIIDKVCADYHKVKEKETKVGDWVYNSNTKNIYKFKEHKVRGKKLPKELQNGLNKFMEENDD